MAFVLSKPGAESDWVSLSDAMLKYVEDKEDESVKEAYEKLKGFDVKVRVLTRLQAIELWDILEKAETHTAKIKADLEALRLGLAAVRGTDCDDKPIDAELIEMLMASGVGPQIALVVRSWQIIDEDQRAGFFTREQAA